MILQTFEDIKQLVENDRIKKIEISLFSEQSKMYYHKTADGINLYFTKKWCEENQELLNKILIYIIQNYKEKKLFIVSGSLINDEVIKTISQNKNIEEVSFGNIFDPYTLKENDYITLKATIKKIESSDVEEKLKNNFDEIIDYNRNKKLIGYNSYEELQQDEISITNPVKEEELEYVKYIGDKSKIEVYKDANIIDIIEKLRSFGKNNVITYNLNNNNKQQFNEELFKRNIPYENVFIKIGLRTYKLEEYVEYEKMLYSFIEPAKNLSPFEKYIYAYDIVKRFKKYKENNKDKMKARNLYDILKNNYMVCVGFSKMLGDLLDKLGIENMELHADVGLQPYKASTQLKKKYKEKWDEMDQQEKNKLIDEQKNYIPDSWVGHSRRIVHIVDEKYGINGIYFSDPTWDNDLENNLYNHLLMTSDEVLTSRKKIKFERESYELLYSTSIKEFNEKLNVILNRTKITEYTTYESELKFILRNLMSTIKLIDKDFYNKIYKKYKSIDSFSYEIKNIHNLPEETVEFLYEVANYIVNNNNKQVVGSTILKAVKNVYDNVYVNGMTEEELEKIKQKNSESAEFSENKFKK